MINARAVKEIQRLMRREMSDIQISFGCEVVSVSESKDRARVRLSVRDTVNFEFPEILDIPIFCLKAGKGIIHIPTTVGDRGLVVFSTKPTEQFKNPVKTSYKDVFDIDNAFYFGGFFNNNDDKSDLVDNLRIKYGDDIVDMKDGEIDVTTTTVNVNATTVNVNATNTSLGTGGQPIARLGDQVTVGGNVGTITSAGINTSI